MKRVTVHLRYQRDEEEVAGLKAIPNLAYVALIIRAPDEQAEADVKKVRSITTLELGE